MKRISGLSPGCRGADLYHVWPHLSLSPKMEPLVKGSQRSKRSSNVANPINHDPKHNLIFMGVLETVPSHGRFIVACPHESLTLTLSPRSRMPAAAWRRRPSSAAEPADCSAEDGPMVGKKPSQMVV